MTLIYDPFLNEQVEVAEPAGVDGVGQHVCATSTDGDVVRCGTLECDLAWAEAKLHSSDSSGLARHLDIFDLRAIARFIDDQNTVIATQRAVIAHLRAHGAASS
jgi:hypothetical protein